MQKCELGEAADEEELVQKKRCHVRHVINTIQNKTLLDPSMIRT